MIWLLLAIILMIVLIFFRVNILITAPIVSIFLCLVSGLDVVDTMASGFMVSFATFAQNNFLIFASSALFAKVMQDTGMAASIAKGISQKLGAHLAVFCVFVVSAILTYGGVSLFVVVFVIYPVALQLFKEANITRSLIPGAIAAGAFTFAAFCLPGSPQAGPIIATQYLGTDLMVMPVLGIVCALFMFVIDILYFHWVLKRSRKAGRGFESDPAIEEEIKRIEQLTLPNVWLSVLPIVVVVITVNFIKLPVYYCMAIGVVISMAFGWKNIPDKLETLNSGVESAIFALINTCAANGFGGVAQQTQGFADLVEIMTTTTVLPPLLSIGIATTLIAGACGSGTGGLGIAVSTLGPIYLDMGINPGLIHRIACVSCCGLDSLPHNGAVVTLLKYTGISHKDGYIHIGVTTVIVPLLTLALMVFLGAIGLTF